ncbi:MAG: patatin-like phospholipase family protein [Mycobacterium leprae]
MPHKLHVARVYRPNAPPDGGSLHIALVLSGAVALGSFEAGVLYELLMAIKSGAPLTIDIVVGSSAGALVGAMTTKCLTTGAPFENVMPQWTEFTLQELTSIYETREQAEQRGEQLDRGVLSSESIRQLLREYLVKEPVERNFQPVHPADRVSLTMAITNLDGLPLTDEAQQAHRFAEAVTFRFMPPEPDRLNQSPYPPAIWERVADVCRASSAFPGAFDPVSLKWIDRIRAPGLVEECWENDALHQRLDELDPTLQPKMRYADGGILDDHPMERAIKELPFVMGGDEIADRERLVYDPRRCVLFVEPVPPVTSMEALRAGTPQTWLAALGRAARLWTLGASPITSARRLLAANKRQERLFQFLSDLARRMAEEGDMPEVSRALRQYQLMYPGLDVLQRVGTTDDEGDENLGLLDPELYQAAIHAFYRWLVSDWQYDADQQWLRTHASGRLKESHSSVQSALAELREAYMALEGLDPNRPYRHQAVLEEVHIELAESLGLAQPWIALQRITPEDPKQMLKGEGIAHFGGFFSREFLRHDYEVGRYYAYLWLKEVVPGFVPPEGTPSLPKVDGGLDVRLLWQNRAPLWRCAGRLVAVLLEAMGLRYASDGQLMMKLLGWSLLLSTIHAIVLWIGAWVGWVTFPTQYQSIRFWLLAGSGLFPLTLGLLLGLTLRIRPLQAVWQYFTRSRHAPHTTGGSAPTGR